jgi:beta-lactamase regulating signal transducer with metallopeptidase domain
MITMALFAENIVSRLAWTSVQAALLIGLVWLAARQLPRLSAATRSLLWWLLGVQLLLGMLMPTPVSLPLLSPSPARVVAAPSMEPATPTMAASSEHRIGGFNPSIAATPYALASTASHGTSVPNESPTSFHWQTMLLSLWLAGVLVHLVMAVRQSREARAIVRASQPLDDPALQAACAAQANALGLRRCPAVRVSHDIESPQVSGLWRPTVLLPARHTLSPEDSALALAHELTHLRRGDLWMGWIPAIAQRMFFFHPLVRWAMREYALHREAACDAQVVQQHHAAPQAYGRLLLRLGVAHPLHAGLAGASPTFHNLRRRLTMLQLSQQDTLSRTRSWLLVALVAAIGVLPYRVTQATPDQPAAQPASSSSTAPAPTTHKTVTTSTTSTALPAVPPVPPVPKAPPVPRTPAVPPVPPAPPAPPAPAEASGFPGHHAHIVTHSEAEYGFALLDQDSVTVNGTEADLEVARNLRKNGEPLVFFRRGGQSYVIQDQAFVARARTAYAPVTAIAQEQGKLGGEQGRLGGQQGAVGAREGALGMREAAIAQREASLDMRESQGKSGDAAAGERAGIKAETAEIERERAELERQQNAMDRQLEALDKQQEALGRRQQEATTRANEQMTKLLDEALAKGVAQPLSKR